MLEEEKEGELQQEPMQPAMRSAFAVQQHPRGQSDSCVSQGKVWGQATLPLMAAFVRAPSCPGTVVPEPPALLPSRCLSPCDLPASAGRDSGAARTATRLAPPVLTARGWALAGRGAVGAGQLQHCHSVTLPFTSGRRDRTPPASGSILAGRQLCCSSRRGQGRG